MKRRVLSILLALVLMLGVLPVTALAADTYTFRDRNGNRVTVPTNAFAKRVVSFTHGNPWTRYSEQQKVSNTLGLPDRTGDETSSKGDLCLGAGGVLVLEFELAFYDGEGIDLYVFEVGDQVEPTNVEVSDDLRTWYNAGSVSGRTAGIDLHGKIPQGSSFRYVRLTDLKKYPTGSWPGADIDAVCGVNTKPIQTNITVTFNPNGGKVTPTTKQYTANTTLGTLPTPTRTGYKFNGWYTARTGGTKVSTTKKVTADMTLYAQWTKNPTTTNVTITLNANGGTLSTKSLSVAKNSAYYSKLPTPTRKGYEFDGWYTTRTGGTKITSSTKATASRTIYAHWTEIVEEKDINCCVTFNPTGGTVIQKHKTVLQGTRYRDLPTPTRSGYQFLGWYTASSGGTKVSPTTKVTKTGNHTLYARWSKNAVTVRTAKDGSWTVYIPPYCRVALYASQTGLTQTSTCAPRTSEYGVKCMKTVTLSNGTQRYYGSFNGKNYWFQFSCEMDVD